MEEDRKITIRLNVNGLTIPVVVPMKDEPQYRNAAKNINTTINSYKQLFIKTKSEEEILMMAMIDIALRYEQERERKDTEVYNDILSSLTKEVEEVL
ncbi:MAG: cell division protein ZapA [Bacteroidaceae bacterium]|nr:cell division protein ZapA [Bacteroidaceae bacterium]